MNTSEVLYGAADHLDRFGHLKYALHGDGDPATAPACALGAIGVSAKCANDNINHAFTRAFVALGQHLGGDVINWNNADERTASEVIEAFRAAAVIEAAKETADERETVAATA